MSLPASGRICTRYSVKPGALMPSMKLSLKEARDIARYIMTAELSPEPAPKLAQRLPLLDRRVSYEEVSEKVFRKTCWTRSRMRKRPTARTAFSV